MGSIMSTLFIVALLASGQNSTITGTLTGQIVMEGFLNYPFKLDETIITSLAVIPVFSMSYYFSGNDLKNGTIARIFSSLLKYCITLLINTVTMA